MEASMHWPKSAGKGVEGFVDAETSRFDRVSFEHDVKECVGRELASKLRSVHFQVLFEISDDYVRRYTAVSRMKNKNRLLKDWRARAALMAASRKWLVDFQRSVNAQALDRERPLTQLLAVSVSETISKVQHVLDEEFELIDLHQRLSASMLRTLSLKYMRTSYAAHLISYIEDGALCSLPDKQKRRNADKLLEGVMSAAGVFTAAEKAADLQGRIPMIRWRAKDFMKREFYDIGEFPVFQTKPKRHRK
jgi:hypothetical protein